MGTVLIQHVRAFPGEHACFGAPTDTVPQETDPDDGCAVSAENCRGDAASAFRRGGRERRHARCGLVTNTIASHTDTAWFSGPSAGVRSVLGVTGGATREPASDTDRRARSSGWTSPASLPALTAQDRALAISFPLRRCGISRASSRASEGQCRGRSPQSASTGAAQWPRG